ncbi:MAG: hypothetical protein KAS38_17315 [Anaerolineales bacterium]|nr:hypothetical protein [Anaerolineales bacterium]MCK5313579.1 hypothetical protein [Anaerolineales bacterium]
MVGLKPILKLGFMWAKGIRSCYTGLAILNHDIGEALLHVVRGSLKGGE